MNRPPIQRTVYLRDATATDLEVTLQELGACRESKNLDGWRWTLAASDDVVVEIQVLENLDSWLMELSIESFNEWRAPFAGQGWEPTTAAILLSDESAIAASGASELVKAILTNHTGVADDER